MTEVVLDVIGVLILVGLVGLAVGAVTGRVRARNCCSLPADHDVRVSEPAEEPPRP